MIEVIRKLTYLLDGKQKYKLVFLFFITLIGACFEAFGVSLMIPMFSVIMDPLVIETNKGISTFCKFFSIYSHRSFVVVCILALIAVFIFKTLFLTFQYYLQARFVCNSRFATQKRLFHSFLSKPYEYFLNASSGEVIRTIQTNVVQAYNLLTNILFMFAELIVSLALIVTIFVIDWQMTLFVVLMMTFILLLIAKVIKPILKREGEVYQRSVSQSIKWILQSVEGIKELKVSQKEHFFENEYHIAGEKQIHAEKVNEVSSNIPRLLIEMVSVCSMLMIMAIEILRGRDIESLVPILGSFAMAAVKLMPSANRIVGALNAISYNQPALDRLLIHLDDMTRMNEDDLFVHEVCSREAVKISEGISLDSISYRYPNMGKEVLRNASMEIPVGKTIGIVGSSGAGKTTVADILLGLLQPQSGKVVIDGKDIMTAYSDWLSSIGYIPQMIFMLDDSIRANIAFGVDKECIDDEAVWHCLEEAQLADFVRGLPNGIDTMIGERGVRISGGQRQRIGIARALYGSPELLIFDEATSALDNETEAAIIEAINSLHGEKTMVIIAHRLQTIEGCDIVYRVEEGKILRER